MKRFIYTYGIIGKSLHSAKCIYDGKSKSGTRRRIKFNGEMNEYYGRKTLRR